MSHASASRMPRYSVSRAHHPTLSKTMQKASHKPPASAAQFIASREHSLAHRGFLSLSLSPAPPRPLDLFAEQ